MLKLQSQGVHHTDAIKALVLRSRALLSDDRSPKHPY
jgi:hypothetical protein